LLASQNPQNKSDARAKSYQPDLAAVICSGKVRKYTDESRVEARQHVKDKQVKDSVHCYAKQWVA